MPRVVDRRPRRVADKDPLAGLLGYDLTEAAEYAGQGIRDFMLQIRDTWAQWLKEATGIDLTAAAEFFDWFIDQLIARSELDLSSPQALVTSLGDLLKNGAEQLFNGIISISRIGDVIQDLINGAGEFLNADSVAANPFWSWDSVMPGWQSGGSIRATANGTQQVLRKDNPFDVFEGQVLNLRAGTRWTGFTALAGSNPIKVGWTPYDANGNPLADVIKGVFQPSTTDAAGWHSIPIDDWTVPAGVAKVTPLVILDSGATAGSVWISNVLPWASNLLPQNLVDGLEAAVTEFTTGIKSLFDTIGGAIGAGAAEIEARLAALGLDGKIDAAELENLANIGEIAVEKIVGLVEQLAAYALKSAVQTFMDTVGGTVGASMTDIFNRLSKLSSTGTIAGAAITGVIAEAQTGLASLRDAAGQAWGFVGSALSNNDVQNQMIEQKKKLDAAAAAVEALVAQLARDQPVNSGMRYSTRFGGADGAALPAEFTGTDLVIRGSSGYAGIKSGLADGIYFAPCSKQYTSDDQMMMVVLGDQGGNTAAPDWYLFHSDSAYTTGAYLKVDFQSLTIGSYTRSGSSFTFTPFSGGSVSGDFSQASAVGVRNVGTSWQITVGTDGTPALTVSNSSVTFGAARRYGGGIVMRRYTDAGGWFVGPKTYDGFRLAAMNLGDYVVPTVVGTTARINRTSNTNVNVINGPTLLPNNFYGNIVRASPDITVDLTTGKFTVLKTSIYLVTVRMPANLVIWPTTLLVSIAKNNAIEIDLNYAGVNNGDDNGTTTATAPVYSPLMTVQMYLNAGDYIQVAGTGAGSTTPGYITVTGEATGKKCYFEITKIGP